MAAADIQKGILHEEIWGSPDKHKAHDREARGIPGQKRLSCTHFPEAYAQVGALLNWQVREG